jgi:hypothetical protein
MDPTRETDLSGTERVTNLQLSRIVDRTVASPINTQGPPCAITVNRDVVILQLIDIPAVSLVSSLAITVRRDPLQSDTVAAPETCSNVLSVPVFLPHFRALNRTAPSQNAVPSQLDIDQEHKVAIPYIFLNRTETNYAEYRRCLRLRFHINPVNPDR